MPFGNTGRKSVNDPPVETVSKREIQTGKIDDDRVYSFEYIFDCDELLRVYNDLVSTPDNVVENRWPEQSRISVGWGEVGVQQYKAGYPSSINNYPYIKELIEEFSTDITAVKWYRDKPHFAYAIHYDHASRIERPQLTPRHVMHTKPQFTEEEANRYIEWRLHGTKTALAVLLKGHSPIEFTHENQRDWPEALWSKGSKDYRYKYKSALLNTQWTHYTTGDDVHERLMFRFSFFDRSFEDTKTVFKNKGL